MLLYKLQYVAASNSEYSVVAKTAWLRKFIYEPFDFDFYIIEMYLFPLILIWSQTGIAIR